MLTHEAGPRETFAPREALPQCGVKRLIDRLINKFELRALEGVRGLAA